MNKCETTMGLRETLNQKRGLTTTIATILTVGAIGFLVMQIGSASGGDSSDVQGYFSSDDGKTFFADSADKLPPFDHNGQQAVRAHVFTCDDGKTLFVGYLSRYTADALAKLSSAKGTDDYERVAEQAFAEGVEVKRPGDGEWVKRGAPEAARVANPSCPNGGTLKAIF
jgi:hypothetical protein